MDQPEPMQRSKDTPSLFTLGDEDDGLWLKATCEGLTLGYNYEGIEGMVGFIPWEDIPWRA